MRFLSLLPITYSVVPRDLTMLITKYLISDL